MAKKESIFLDPFKVSLNDFVNSIPDGVTIKEQLKGFTADQIETVEREVQEFNQSKNQ